MTNGGTGTADLLAPCRSNSRIPFFLFFFLLKQLQIRLISKLDMILIGNINKYIQILTV